MADNKRKAEELQRALAPEDRALLLALLHAYYIKVIVNGVRLSSLREWQIPMSELGQAPKCEFLLAAETTGQTYIMQAIRDWLQRLPSLPFTLSQLESLVSMTGARKISTNTLFLQGLRLDGDTVELEVPALVDGRTGQRILKAATAVVRLLNYDRFLLQRFTKHWDKEAFVRKSASGKIYLNHLFDVKGQMGVDLQELTTLLSTIEMC